MGISSGKDNAKIKELKLHKRKEISTSIKSYYNLMEIFSFLNTKQKLNIIIYNKQLQKKLRINIEDYKKKKMENIKQVEKMEKERNIY